MQSLKMENLFLPGDEMLENSDYIRGHGTQLRNEKIASVYFGRLKITDKLATVDPIFPLKYSPEVGDVVVGRILSICNKKWRVELNSKSDAYLGLSAISLPGVVQRRKQESDEISMRDFFDIGDVVVSEVQKVNKNGSVALHTRNEKYGKLSAGVCLFVPHFLLEPLKSRFISSDHIYTVVGCNGFVWFGENNGNFSSIANISAIASRVKSMSMSRMNIDVEKLLKQN